MKKTENVATINLENMLSELYSLETQRKQHRKEKSPPFSRKQNYRSEKDGSKTFTRSRGCR